MHIRKAKLNQSGFTLIELLIVIGILAILLAITLLALNPTQHFQGARNAQRSSDVTAILDGIYEYEAAHTGSLPASVSNVTSAVPLNSGQADQTATGTSFSTPDLTLTVPSGNTITTGTVTIGGCSVAADNGTFPVTSGSSTTVVVTNAGASATSATGCVVGSWSEKINVCADLVPTYLADVPLDPGSGTKSPSTGTACSATTYSTGYTIAKSAGNRFTVAAPGAEGGTTISVTR
jgi:prepilin-type N-terminal cleavage/methylation domain-containing protein